MSKPVVNPYSEDHEILANGNEFSQADRSPSRTALPGSAAVKDPAVARRSRLEPCWAGLQAGVPEYWVVDPKRRSALLYQLDATRHVYQEPGRFAIDDVLRSVVLGGFELKVAGLFP